MKAAVLYQRGGMPQYADCPEPVVQHDNELVLTMKAAAIKHIDKSRARGKHYSTKGDINKAEIIGGDGVGILENRNRVYAIGDAMLAEKTVVDKQRIVPIPEGLDDITAAALPNAVIGSAMALLYKAGIQKGDTVLINGATGFTGKIAMQIAKYYGAGKITATGRNEVSLQALKASGADKIIPITSDDETFISQIKKAHSTTPIDIIIDYLWGHTAELILSCLQGKGTFTHTTRFVSIGSVTGDTIQLSAAILRSVDLQLSGSGLGSWSKEEVKALFQTILPEMFQLAADNKLVVDTVNMPLQDIEKLWERDAPDGRRLVVTI